MAHSDSEFGEVDESGLVFAVTEAEQTTSSAGIPSSHSDMPYARASPRIRRSEDTIRQKSFPASESLLIQESASEDDACADEDEESVELLGTPDKKKRKLKAHVPKHDVLYEDAFCTQLSRSSDSPYRIRGPIWQKQKPLQGELNCGGRFSGLQEPTVLRERDEHRQNIASEALLHHRKPANQLDPIPWSKDSPGDFDISDEEGFEYILEMPAQQRDQRQHKEQMPNARLAGPLKNLKQTTLFGTQSVETVNAATQSDRRHNWPLAGKQEKPTHHKLVGDELVSWVYPTNLGTIREYQFNIVARGLYHNLLVALPTGLGKTFIAATIMLNWFRWTKDSQIVFVAPTKPLVSQQVDACFNIAGIPRSATTMLTGGIPPGVRAEEWIHKRVFFMTPQTLINDLKTGICDPKRIVLLVVDEAHRATGGYAYVEVVNFLRRFNTSFRVLALTATPGSSVESVQAVIDGLGISKVEIRTEESLDIRQYVHPRKIETIEFEPSEEMSWIFENLSKALQPLVDLMRGKNAYWSKDPMSLTAWGCNQARQKWMASDAGRRASQGEKGQVLWVFSTLASFGHSIELLKYHGIVPFYHKLKSFRDDDKAGKYAKQVKEHQSFNQVLARLRAWVTHPDFIGHPKLDHLQGVVLEHFVSASEGRHLDPEVSPNKTRVMIFAHFRDSAEEIVRVLNRNSPMVRAHVFVGQASASGSDGMNQKKQLEIIEEFRKGIHNTIVATSIGEEGLDIGEVDLIICYDASASPIRMLQRMGRTGRKRAGEIVVLLMKGKEANSFEKAKDNYGKMQQMIADGQRFNYHTDLSPRIVPKEIQPIVDKRIVEIPKENAQTDLPEPSKRGKASKRPPKKFNMPDGVRTGFTTASRLGKERDSGTDRDSSIPTKRKPKITSPKLRREDKKGSAPVMMPSVSSVLLSRSEEAELDRNYLQIAGDSAETVEMPRLDAFPELQRTARPIAKIKHGKGTERLRDTLRKMNRTTMSSISEFQENLYTEDTEIRQRKQTSGQNHLSREAANNQAETCRMVPRPTPIEDTSSINQKFWVSPEKDAAVMEASQDLPDLDTMLRRTTKTNQEQSKRLVRKRKTVIESDSDG